MPSIILSSSVFQHMLNLTNVAFGYLLSGVMYAVAVSISSAQFVQYTRSGGKMFLYFGRWTVHLSVWKKIGYFIELGVVLAPSHSSVVLERFDIPGIEYCKGIARNMTLNPEHLATTPSGKCNDLLLDGWL
ncbi:hypothetical protein DL89DRAFT_254567 [Linderina pennispora]|uniref:Uncharacterized protein n=1 Tax=Linderina pennispora TaxID=61395 RepID=A0A1Y1WMK9_9FUNG|nr:uncharacterized protein DL89DRAFT_254567 [Linderina pennispora]ORX74789.1 hypothetical protein DL89DRAFT_254567 [Linderina pennispora]